MVDNPFTPPKSSLTADLPEPAVPDNLVKKIRSARNLGLLSGVIMLVMTAFMISDSSGFDLSALGFVDAALVFGLAFGIHKKSRVCAVVMLIYFVISKAIQLVELGGTLVTVPVALVCLYYYWMGVVGTFGYHKYIRIQKNQALADA